jgi:hypothetical protein
MVSNTTPCAKRKKKGTKTVGGAAGVDTQVYSALSYEGMRPYATGVCGLKLLVYEA